MAKFYGGQSQYLISEERKARISFWLSFLFFLWGAIGYFLFCFSENDNFLLFFAAVFFIGLAGAVSWFAGKAAWRVYSFKRGRIGEYEVSRVLRKLSDKYYVFWDVKLPQLISNIDFVVAGPTGVFAIEVKHCAGSVEFNGEVLTRNGQPFKKDILKQAERGAAKLAEYLGIGFARPILVFSHNYTKLRFGLKPQKRVLVVRKEFLLKAIYQNNVDFNISGPIINRLKGVVAPAK